MITIISIYLTGNSLVEIMAEFIQVLPSTCPNLNVTGFIPYDQYGKQSGHLVRIIQAAVSPLRGLFMVTRVSIIMLPLRGSWVKGQI